MFFNSNPSVNKIRYYFSFVMIAVYLALGFLFLFTDTATETFPVYRKPVGIVMLVYAVLRTYFTIKKYKNIQKDEY